MQFSTRSRQPEEDRTDRRGGRTQVAAAAPADRSVREECRRRRERALESSHQRAHYEQHPVRRELEEMSQEIKFCWVNITLVPAVKNNEMSSGWPSEIMQSAVQFELDAMMLFGYDQSAYHNNAVNRGGDGE